MTAPAGLKPLPRISSTAQPYWDGLKAGRLMIQGCVHCGRLRHYPRPVCEACYSMDVAWVEARGRGAVHSWTVCHHAFHPGFGNNLPYTLLTVDLEEGVRAMGRLRHGDTARLEIGLPVIVGFEPLAEEFALPVFDIAEGGPIRGIPRERQAHVR